MDLATSSAWAELQQYCVQACAHVLWAQQTWRNSTTLLAEESFSSSVHDISADLPKVQLHTRENKGPAHRTYQQATPARRQPCEWASTGHLWRYTGLVKYKNLKYTRKLSHAHGCLFQPVPSDLHFDHFCQERSLLCCHFPVGLPIGFVLDHSVPKYSSHTCEFQSCTR